MGIGTKLTADERKAIEIMLEVFLGESDMDSVYEYAQEMGEDGDEIISTLYKLGGVEE